MPHRREQANRPNPKERELKSSQAQDVNLLRAVRQWTARSLRSARVMKPPDQPAVTHLRREAPLPLLAQVAPEMEEVPTVHDVNNHLDDCASTCADDALVWSVSDGSLLSE